jgi:hypothetical protein
MISLRRISHLFEARYSVELEDGENRLTFELWIDSRDGIDVVCWAPEFEALRDANLAVNFSPLFEAILAVHRARVLPMRSDS